LYQDPYQLFFELTTKNATVRYASSWYSYPKGWTRTPLLNIP
jgi:hypothetical protein